MAMQQSKLSDVFNKCAGKVVMDIELEKLFQKALEKVLTVQEMRLLEQTISDYTPDPESMLADPVRVKKLLEEVGDGSVGLYFSPPVFSCTHIKFLELLEHEKLPVTALSGKVFDALAEAIEKATDYRYEVMEELKKGTMTARYSKMIL